MFEVDKTGLINCSTDVGDTITTDSGEENNLINGGWTVGGLVWATGAEYNSTSSKRTKFFEVDGNTQYVFSLDGVLSKVYVFEYDANKTFIGTIEETQVKKNKITTKTDTKFFRLLKLNNTDLTENIKCEVGDTPTIKYKFRAILENCTIDYLENTIEEGTHTFTITPDEGYELIEKGNYSLGKSPDPVTKYDFFPSSKEVATITIDVDNVLTIRLNATKKVESISNFTLLYKTTDNELGKLSVERFHNEEGGTLRDYGNNILKLYKLPFEIDIETIESNIQWGNVKSSVASKKLTKSRFTLDLGTIIVPEKYGNAFDYKNGEVEIFLPFIDSITTDLKTVMNKELNFSLVVNLYSGQATVNISSNGEIVFSKDTDVCLDIPFIQSTTGTNFNTLKTYLINDVRKVKLVITRQIPKGTVFSSSDRMLGSDIHGYIEGDIISSNYENMLSLDIYELQNKIRTGVKF